MSGHEASGWAIGILGARAARQGLSDAACPMPAGSRAWRAWCGGHSDVLTRGLFKPPGLFWFSFADPKRAKGTQFLGIIVIAAGSFTEALAETHARGINPGGACEGTELHADATLPIELCNRLLDRAEAERASALLAPP